MGFWVPVVSDVVLGSVETLLEDVSFKNGSYEGLALADVLGLMRGYMEDRVESVYKVIVGTDSQVFQRGTIFVTGLVLLRDGKEAFACRGKYVDSDHLMNMRDKISKETEITLKFGDRLEEFVSTSTRDVCLEVHMDVGLTEMSETRYLVDEVLDRLSSCDCEVVMKPDAYVASGYANFYTKRGG